MPGFVGLAIYIHDSMHRHFLFFAMGCDGRLRSV